MIARPRTGPALTVEDRENLDAIQELLRRIERGPDATLPRANARALACTLSTRKYLRISKDRLDAYGPGTQDEDILQACERETFQLPGGGYEDHITAGGRLIRHDFDRMRADAHAKQFGMLLVGRSDRFSRNITMGMLHTFELILAGVYVYFCDEDLIAGLDQNWREILERKLAEAASVLRTITKNNRTTARLRRRRGEWLGGVPFGWQLSPDRLVVSQYPTEWPAVERMIELLREDTLPLYGIAARVTSEGHRDREGGPISKELVRSALHNPLLRGCWPVNKKRGRSSPDYEEVRKFVGPLSDAEARELKSILARRARSHQSPDKIKHDYVLLKLLQCGEIDPATGQVCGVPMYGITPRRAGHQQWYTNYGHPPGKGCYSGAKPWMVSERHLLSQLDALFANAVLPPQALEVMAAHLAETRGAARVDRELLRKRFQDDLGRADQGYLYRAYGDDPKEALAKWQQHRGDILAKIAELGEEPAPLREREIQQVRNLPQLWAAGNTAERRQILRALFTAVRIVREPSTSDPAARRPRNTARITHIEPRPEYADLIGYAFSGLMLDPRSAARHRPQTDCGPVALAFVQWLKAHETGQTAAVKPKRATEKRPAVSGAEDAAERAA